MRRRICLVGAALSVCPLAFIAGNATAASTKSKSPVTKVACASKTSIMVANGDTGVSPPVSQGSEYGPVQCGGTLGRGILSDSFTVPASGDTVAKYTMYFHTGTVHGTYDITPQPGSLNFLETDWTGTLKVLGGTGAYKAVTGTGTMTCKSLDGIHTTCTNKLKLKGA